MVASESVAIFWDYENCTLPALEPSYAIVNKIRRLAHRYGSVKTFKAYLEYPEQVSVKSMALRSELQSCGVSLIDCPHNGRKDVADKMMMVDMMAHAIDNPAPTTIVLISGNRDFVYAVSILSLRRYRVVLLAPRGAHSSLKAQASVVYNWPEDFLPELPPATSHHVPSCRPQNSIKSGTSAVDISWGSGSVDADSLGTSDDYAESETLVPGVPAGFSGDSALVPERVDEPHDKPESSQGNQDIEPPTASSSGQEGLSRDQSNSPTTQQEPKTWAYFAKPGHTRSGAPSSPVAQKHPSPVANNIFIPATTKEARAAPSTPPGLHPKAATFDLTPQHLASGADDGSDDGAEWQTYSRAAKKPPAHVPSEFKPLVRVLKRQLAEGVVQLESSLLGQLLSQEVARLSIIYERAGVTRLKEYTTLAAERAIVTATRESADGHNYIALHPAYRRKAAAA